MRKAPRKSKKEIQRRRVVISVVGFILFWTIAIVLVACIGNTKKAPAESVPSSSSEITIVTTTTEPTTQPTNTPTPEPTPTPVPTNTPTPEPTPTPVPTDTPTPEPTPTLVPTDTPTPKPTKSTKSTKAPTEPTEPKPTETTPKPTETTPKPTETTPKPTEPQPSESDPPGRNLRAEYDAALAHVKALGYTVTVENSEKYKIKFTNATGTYKGSATVGRGAREWEIEYFPIDRSDPNATYIYSGIGFDPVAMLDEIDPSWMNYSG